MGRNVCLDIIILFLKSSLYFVVNFKKEHGVPSSLAGKSIDLIKEDDGGSDGPRLPKHLQPASATIEQRRRREGGWRGHRTNLKTGTMMNHSEPEVRTNIHRKHSTH